MPKNSRGLLAHVVTKFVPRQWENIASESLLYLLPKAGGNLALNHLLAPVGFRLEGETWRPQDGSGEDSSIPDLVAKVHDRPKLIIETKFWASLTDNQPLGYLDRQARLYAGSEEERLLLFLVPTRRLPLLTAELGTRLGDSVVRSAGALTVLDSERGRVAIVSWSQLLGHLRSAFESEGDESALDDLAQLEGLCDKADQDAMLPLANDEIDSTRGHRIGEMCEVVAQVARQLVADGTVARQRHTGNPNGWGPNLRSASGHKFLLWVSYEKWGTLWPTPWWLQFDHDAEEIKAALGPLMGDADFPVIQIIAGQWLDVALRAPVGVEEDQIVAELTGMVSRVCALLPNASHSPDSDTTEVTGADEGYSALEGDLEG
ncbi:MAG: hypothetical protein IPO93_18475 [Actinobacteria bacterium]|jgi:hypothetical protein|nr:hypothetical protein [Actinomycetota bacterium]